LQCTHLHHIAAAYSSYAAGSLLSAADRRPYPRRTDPTVTTNNSPEPSKACRSCGDVKPLSAYYKRSDAPDGRQHACKVCQKASSKANSSKPETKARRQERAHTPEGRELTWAQGVEYRVRKYGGEVVERVWRLEVFARDGWLCQHCAKPVLRETGQHPESATVDHILPVAEGGEHSYKNTCTAHRKCNRSKWDRSIAELIADDIEKLGAVSLPVFRLALMFPAEAFPVDIAEATAA
jgi:5-methylcytosine-specific restriction endonuclease McrA